MSVDQATVRRIAKLARIRVPDEEIAGLQGELNAILAFVETLGEVDVEGVEPMTSVMPMPMKKRRDEVTDGEIADLVMAQELAAAVVDRLCATRARHVFHALDAVAHLQLGAEGRGELHLQPASRRAGLHPALILIPIPNLILILIIILIVALIPLLLPEGADLPER